MKQHLLCVHGTEWIYLSRMGVIFGTGHQLLILMQINITQYVLVRIPRNMGIFDQTKNMQHLMASGLRTKLLETGINETSGEPLGEDSYKTADGKISLGRLLQKIKESKVNNDDNFRV